MPATAVMPTPTLIVFTLGAAAERARRPLLGARLRGVEVALRRSCLAEALAAGRAAGLRRTVCSPRPVTAAADEALPQRRGSFGERLAAAMEEAFARGAAPLVVVGADSPGLSAAHLEAALARLAADPAAVVVGPCPDGGLYLLAANRPIPGLAAAARWCRADTLATLLASLRAAGRPVALLPPLADLDRPADLAGWLATPGPAIEAAGLAAWRPLVVRLVAALARPASPHRAAAPRHGVVLPAAGRAPPLLTTFA
jgi:hypothetical protein